jgi:diguanylate cyclase (GGDEF)-like protein/PAS domain S-box-containing protein
MSISTWVGNFAIRAKIMVGFVIVLALLLGLGATALQLLGSMNAAVAELTGDGLATFRYLVEARFAADQYRRALAFTLLEGDADAARENEQPELAVLRERFQASGPIHRPAIVAVQQAPLNAATGAAWRIYGDLAAHLQALLAAGALADAKAFYLSDMMPAATALDTAIHAELDDNQAALRRQGAMAEASYRSARTEIVAFMVLAVLAAALATAILVHLIAMPITAIAAAMRRLAARDMTVALPSYERADEVGEMACALQVFKDAMVALDHSEALLERRNAALKIGRQQLDAALSNMSEGLCFFDQSQRLVVSNRRFAEIYGLSTADMRPGITLEEVVGLRIAAGSGPSITLPQYMDWAEEVIVCRDETEDVAQLANGRVIARRIRLMPDGGWVATHADVTETRAAEVALRESEARFRLLAEHSGDVVVLSDVGGPRRYVSPAAERVLGWRPEDLVGRRGIDLVHPEDVPAVHEAEAAMRAGASEGTACYRLRRPDDSWLWVEARARKYRTADGPDQLVVVLRDATARKAAEQALVEALAHTARMAATDELTGLANRRQFDNAAYREWWRCAREHLPLSVLLLDADCFKQFNDRYGHPAGDACLRAIAGQLDTVARRPGDLPARYGGEEFVLLMPGTDRFGALGVAERLCELVRALCIPHPDNDSGGIVTVSVGVATAIPGDGASGFDGAQSLVSAADAALYQAKRGGRNRVAVAAGPPAPLQAAPQTAGVTPADLGVAG